MKNFLFLAVIVSVSACSTTSSVRIPATQPLSPENEGIHEWSAEGGFRSDYDIILTNQIARTPVNEARHNVNSVSAFGISGMYGINHWIDVGTSINLSTPPVLYAKFQVLGKNKREADAHNFSLAPYVGLGLSNIFEDKYSDIPFPFTTTESGAVLIRRAIHMQAGIQAGYRLSKDVLLTTGLRAGWHSFQGEQNIQPSWKISRFSDHPEELGINTGVMANFPGENAGFIHALVQYGRIETFAMQFFRFSYALDIGFRY